MSHQKNINLTTNQTKNLSKLEFSTTPTLGGGGGGGITHLEQVSLLHRHLFNLLITIALAILLLSCGPKVVEPGTSAVVRINATNTLQSIVEGGTLAGLENSTVSLVTNTLTYLTASANYESAKIEARYATENGAGKKDGTSWTNAWAATDLRDKINGISGASDSKVYAVLVASGTYKPVTTTTATTAQRDISFAMKNHVAIIGGFASSGSWTRNGTTTFSGDIGNVGNTSDNSYHVFSHISNTLDNGLLYGVTITGGNANGSTLQNSGGGMFNQASSPRLVDVVFSDNSAVSGGGMYNDNSSPVLTGVEFTGNSVNSANSEGGGMHNNASSPVLTRVVFTGNSSIVRGGGMFNISSSPVLTGVEFTGNSANTEGGGMFNNASSPVLRGVVFSNNISTGTSGNFAQSGGGGMYNTTSSSPVLRGVVFVGNSAANGEGGGVHNNSSSPVLVGTVFRGNSAKNGGGMYSYNIRSGDGPVIVNSIFVSNSATTGKDIVLDRNGSGNNIKVRVAGSVLGVGTANAISGVVVTNIPTPSAGTTAGSYNLTHHSLTNGAVNFGDNKTTDTATGGLTYPTIESGSSAINVGLYVRKSGTTYYFSQDKSSWYTEFSATGGFDSSSTATPPTGAEDLTATDIAGNARVNRPDAGVSEYTP